MFISRRSVFKELQQRPLKCIFKHDKLRFMASLPSSRLDACPRPLPRALHAQYPPPPPQHLLFSLRRSLRLSSSSSPRTVRLHTALHCATPHHGDHVLFRFIINAFLFPLSFRDNLRYTQSCVSSGVLPSPTPGSFKAVSKVARWSISWPRDICKQRACLLVLLCVSP